MEQFQFSQKTNNDFLKKFWLFVFLSFFSLGVKAQCPTGDVAFSSQAQLDDFAINYPNCTEITGNLFIGLGVNNLNGLSNLTQIGGHLVFLSSQLTNLNGLSNLTQIGGYLQINNNSQLTDLDGLSALESINGNLVIINNAVLTDISGLQNIDPASILPTYGFEYGLNIVSNSSLSVCNLDNFCTYLQGSGPRTISGNAGDCISEAAVNAACSPAPPGDAPTNLSTSNVTSVSATLNWSGTGTYDIEWGTQGFTQGTGTTVTNISTNSYSLTNLDYQTQYQFYVRSQSEPANWVGPFAFTTLSQCPTGDVYLGSQAEVDAFAINYPNCTEITGDLSIGYMVNNLNGLSHLTSVGGNLWIRFNEDLTNLEGLNNLQTVGGYLRISDSLSLTTLDGLSALTSVGGSLGIYENSNLTNLDGISNLTSVGGVLNINSNQNLTNLDGLSNLTSIVGDLLIQNNSSLTDISGLQNIDPNSISFLRVEINPLLSVCNLPNFCTYLQGSGLRTISGNAGDCISEAAVNAACTPACDAPTALTATATSVGATLNWSGAGTYVIEWGPQGFTQGSGTTVTNISTNSYSLTDLDYNTQYQFYVRCQSEPANWVGPFAFTTLSQCPTGDVNLFSQAYVNNFATNYPNCTEVSGELTIQGANITDLTPLSNIQSIGGYLFINNNSQLTNLDGLSNLTQIGGALYIQANSLTNLDGLSALESINGDLGIYNNPVLTDISGLQNIDPATISNGLGLYIVSNSSLSVCNLPNFCTYLQGSGARTISGNAGDCISEAAVNAACTTSQEPQCPTGDVMLYSQAAVDAFAVNYPNCTQISGHLVIGALGGTDIVNLEGLSNVTSVGDFLLIGSNHDLTTLDGLNNLTSVGGHLNIGSNNVLTTLDGLSNLTSVGGNLFIGYTSLITTLDGLSNLESINGTLEISINATLTDISGLENIDPSTISGLTIINNANLSVCNIANFCTYLSNPDNPRTISDNAGDCISEAAVNAACNPAPPCDAPTNLSTSNVTSVSATLGWTSDGSLFDVEWGVAGFTQGSGTTVTDITTNSYDLTNLDYATQYQFYVRCQSEPANWVGPFAFTTLSQCPTGDVNLNSQAQVDAFAINYPNCTEITGDLYIVASAVVHLDGLINLETVGGDFLILETNLTNLDGLNNLTSIGGELGFAYNNSLNNLAGLSNLTSIGGGLSFADNNSLTNLDGLSNLTSIGRNIFIFNNPSLINLNGLQNIDPNSISGEFGLHIVDNPSLSVCNLPNFCTYLHGSGARTISGNAEDCISEEALLAICPPPPCDAPANLTVSGIIHNKATINWTNSGTFDLKWGAVNFTDGNELGTANGVTALNYEITGLTANTAYDVYVRQNCTANQSEWVKVTFNTIAQCPEGSVLFTSQAQVNTFATNYPNCTEISGYLYFYGNDDITDLSPLSNLTSVGGFLGFESNLSLTNLDGLSNLTSVGGFLGIYSNPNLTNISGLENITGFTELYIQNNTALSVCHITSVCAFLEGTGNRTISGNATGCQDDNAILANCPITAIPCDVPENLTVSGIINNKATINWTNSGTFDLKWGAENFTEGNELGTANGVTELNYEITGLTANTAYDVYVRQNCDVNQSDWVKYTFSTTVQCPSGYVNLLSQTQVSNFLINYPNCTHLPGSLHIQGNNIANLTPLSNLVSIGQHLTISGNPALTSLNGLSSLTFIGGELEFYNNNQLTDISALQNVEGMTSLYVVNNSSLSDCDIDSFCSYLSNPDNPRTISGNAGNCITEEAITLICFPPTPSCEVPTNLATTNITADSATLNWESDGASFEIVWGALGFDPEGATPITDIDTTSYTISEGLNAGTQYDFYVRQYCTDDDIVSDWAGPFGFATSVAECPSGDVVFNTQAELDAFAIEYPNCTHISGSLFVSGAGNNITDLSPLNAIVSVSGPLMIMNNFYLTNIDGLSSLTTVGGHLQITNNYWLTDLDGLSNLTSLGADITIAYNDNLASVSGLSGLTTINPVHNEGLRLFENESLTTCEIDVFCDYLSHSSDTHPREIYNNGANCNDEAEIYAACNPPVACSDGDVYINSQEDLDDYVANYPLCTIINGSLFIEESDISDLSGLHNIETIIGDLYISGNQQLTSLNGLTSLETIGGGLFIWVNDNLQDVDGLYSLRTIEGMLSIDSNPLENLNGLNALENIGDELMIAFTGLSNLDGLSNLTSLGADITIAFNDNLESVSGLSGLTTLIPLYDFGLQIFNNPSLSTCNLSVFCDYLSNDPETHPRWIEDNAGDCISEEAVQESCEDMTYGDCDFYTIWNGSQWSHGAPNAETGIVIKGNLNLTEDLEVCDVWIISGVLSVEPGVQLTLNGAIVNNMSADYFLVQSDAVLIQMEGVENLGEITVIRESQDMIRLDYTLWSSPVIGQNLFGFSPETVNGITNYLGSTGRIYVYDGENGYVNPDPFTVASEMENGVGYLFRAPNNWSDTEAAPYIGVFTGAPNNGDIQVTTHAGNYTSIGNPYPSNIRLNDLYVANPDINAVYFWNNTQSTGNNYATCTNGMGCVAAAGGGNTPDGIITTGQGFIVHTDANSVSFDNSMRVNDSGIFFKVDELESHRFWLNLDGEEESYNQTLIGYVSEATNQVDAQIDAKLFNYSGSALYNLIEEESYVIQGRALPFETADEVPLGFRAAQSGKFKISLADFDGLFVEGSVSIYLKDNQLDITHNLMESDYEFESVQGEFKERFEVVYETEETMGTGEFDSNLVQIYQDNGNIIIESKNEKILSVELFDLNGRNLHRNPKVNANHYEIQTKAFGTQVLVVKVQAENGEILTKKLISK